MISDSKHGCFKGYFLHAALLIPGVLGILTSCNPRISGYVPEGSPNAYHLKTLRPLGKELKESSGLCYFDRHFWSINDSGGENLLFSFGSAKKDTIQKTRITGAGNHDWESLDDDSLFIYIADVGDNFGNRKTLFIYRVLKTEIKNGAEIKCDTIQLSLPEKPVNPLSTAWSSYDCEAIVLIDDSIYLFTKNWNDFTTSIYVVPSKPGNYSVPERSVARVNMLVTGADYNECSGKLFLIGYMKYKPVMIIFSSCYSGYLKEKPFTRIEFPARFGTQTEAVSTFCSGDIFISSERSIYPARLFQLIPKE
jgi:hypothetical protein